MMRGDCGFVLDSARIVDGAESSLEKLDTVENEVDESEEVCRDRAGFEVGGLRDTGGLFTLSTLLAFSDRSSDDRHSVILSHVVLSIEGNLDVDPLVVGGLISTGDQPLRKSIYADGGVIGVLMVSSFLRKAGVPTKGLRSSDG